MFKVITIESEDGEESEHKLPIKFEVCSDCHGHGMVLNESMRDYGYSAEEFNESFDDEEKEHYFTRGGMYDVSCPTCKGERVEAVLDEDAIKLNPKLQEIFDQCEEQETERQAADAEDRAYGRLESMMGC